MSVELARRLLAWGAAPAEVEAALLEVVTRGVSLVKALAEVSPALLEQLERETARLDLPSIEMVRASPDIAAELPPGLCERLVAVPVHRDPKTGRVDVAAADAFDSHVQTEFTFHLASPVRVLRARYSAVASALSGLRAVRSIGPRRSEGASSSRSAVSVPPSNPPPAVDPALALIKMAGANTRETDPGRGVSDSEPRYAEVGADEGGEPVLSLARPKGPSVATPSVAPQPPAPPKATEQEQMGRVMAALEHAVAPEEVLDLCCSGLEPMLAVTLAARGSFFEARAGSTELRDPPERLRAVKVPVGSGSVVDTALKQGFYLGTLAESDAHQTLRELLRLRSGEEVYLAPVMVLGRASLVLVVARLGLTTTATRRADEVAAAASQALERIVRNRKRGAN